MALPIKTGTPAEASAALRAISDNIETLALDAIFGGNVVRGIVLSSTVAARVRHGLGRALRGYIVLRRIANPDGNAAMAEYSGDLDPDPRNYVRLYGNDLAVVDLLFF